MIRIIDKDLAILVVTNILGKIVDRLVISTSYSNIWLVMVIHGDSHSDHEHS